MVRRMGMTEFVTESIRASGVSQAAVARALGMQQAAVSRKISGLRRWSLNDVERLNAALPPGERLVLVHERETLAYAAAHVARDRATSSNLPPPEQSDVPLFSGSAA